MQCCSNGGAKLKPFEFSLRLPELYQPDFSGTIHRVGQFQDLLIVDIAYELVGLDADLQVIPFARAIMGGWNFTQHIPSLHCGSIEATESQTTVARIETVMLILTVGIKDEARRARLIVHANKGADLEGNFG